MISQAMVLAPELDMDMGETPLDFYELEMEAFVGDVMLIEAVQHLEHAKEDH